MIDEFEIEWIPEDTYRSTLTDVDMVEPPLDDMPSHIR